jgi:hypothetical protein
MCEIRHGLIETPVARDIFFFFIIGTYRDGVCDKINQKNFENKEHFR